MNNDNFLIEENDLNLAKNICKIIKNPDIRNRAVANVLAADIAEKYFTEIEVDTESGLHKIAHVLNKRDIADVYIKDSYIDVRLYFEGDDLCIPKEHFDSNLLPVAYMFIRLDSELSGGLVTGFVLPNTVNKTVECNGYYKVTEDELISYYDIEALLVQNYTDDTPDNFESQIYDYLDEKLEDETSFYKVLLSSKYCRKQLKNAANVKHIFNYVSLSKDSVNQLSENTSEELETLNTFDTVSEEALESFADIEPLDETDASIELTEDTSIEMDMSSEIEEFEIIEPQEDSLDLIEDNSELSLADSEDISFGIEETKTLSEDNEPTLLIQEEAYSEDEILPEISSIEDLQISTNENLEEAVEEDFPTLEATEKTLTETSSELGDFVETESVVSDTTIDNEPETQYSTNITPSIDTIENDVNKTEASIDELETLLENDSSVFDEEKSEPCVNTDDENADDTETSTTSPQIEELFGEENNSQEMLEEDFVQPSKKNNSKLLPLLGTLVIVGALGYFGYTKYLNTNSAQNTEFPDPAQTMTQTEDATDLPTQDAMPVETVENIKTPSTTNEGNAVSIPAIEQNLDASILVSNLSVNWEVPAGYVTNNTAKRYFTKMGKIIQLNLKTELLLLSKPPITNKIMLELEFDKTNNKFLVKGITASSGEKIVDDLITQTVKQALEINLKTNMSTFGNITGNPVLIIRL